MLRKSLLALMILMLSSGLIFAFGGCAKKVVKEEAAAIAAKPEKAPAPAVEEKKPERGPAPVITREERKPPAVEEKVIVEEKAAPAKPMPPEEVAKVEEKPAIEKVEVDRLKKLFLEEHVHFDFDKFNIKDSEKPKLERKAEWLKEHPDVKVVIEGHCDERGTNEYNLALGQRRADSTKNYLVRLGIDPGRLFTVSYGEEMPLDPRHNEEAWAKNRRAQFKIKSE